MLETSSSLQVQLRQACSKLERRLRAGEGCTAEELLAACPALAADTDSALELIYTEFVLRQELGEGPSPAAFLARFPQWHDDLQKLFQVGAAVGASGCATAHSDALTLL